MKSTRLFGLSAIAASLLLTGRLSADHVIIDDCIIQSSLAVGLDAVNGENFGFDTIRLKENNLRIHFDDTSTSASFPKNDWRIRINDSTNGGDSYFAIEDATANRTPFRVEAGAGNHSLFVEDSGDVGVGTSTPAVRVHLADGDSPTVRLEQNGTSGWTPQTWDVAGNETNFFIRDATNGSTLPFRIRPAAPTNSLLIDAGGAVSVGTASPASGAKFHVETGGGAVDDFVVTGDSKIGIGTNSPDAATHAHIVHGSGNALRLEETRAGTPDNFIAWYDAGGRTGFLGHPNPANNQMWMANEAGESLVLSTNGSTAHVVVDTSGNVTTTGTVNGVSDRNAKEAIVPVDTGKMLEKVLGLPISEWSYKGDDPSVRHVGPMAQDFRAGFGLGKDDKTISFHDPAGVALAAIQGLNEVVEAKDLRIEQLEERNRELEARIGRIERAMQAGR